MKKVIAIEGMTCAHCQARVEKALNAIPGVQAKVDLKKKIATVDLNGDIREEDLMDAVNQAGYQAVSIAEKKDLFGG